jgi:DNA adenine methylase
MSDILRELWELNPSKRFVEPFCGALSASLAVQPRRALLNDWNPHLISLYQGIKDGREWDIFMVYQEELFYQYREAFNEFAYVRKQSDWEQAQLFFYLIQTCFNGLCRFNQMGEFNVGFGKYKSVNYERDLEAYRRQFRFWTFSNKQFDKLRTWETDFLFIDPPYDETFSSYTPEGFNWDDQLRVAHWAAQHPGPVMCTNSTSNRVMHLYLSLGFEVRVIPVSRSINSDGTGRSGWEMIATRNMETGPEFRDSTLPIRVNIEWDY